MTMRILILTLILAIGFSGYSAAAHAFDMEFCSSAAMSQMDDEVMDMSDCPGHQDESAPAQDSDNDGHAKGKCLDCHHCCTSHAVGMIEYSVIYPLQAKLHNPLPDSRYRDFFSFSLLRPPKSLV